MLSSKLALITGAGSGIGRATCIACAREGARIIAADRNLKNAQDVVDIIGGKENIALELDVADSQSIKHVFDEVYKKYTQPPTVLVNSAGITMDDFIVNMKEENFDKVIQVNLKGTFLTLQTCGKLLVENKLGGSIVNIASIVGKLGNLGQANYAASKAGVELVTKTAAQELGKFNIRVNAVLPGFISTPMLSTVPDKVKELFKKKIGLKRLGQPEEIAEVIVFLGSDRSSYVNGASIEVTGGV